MADTRTKYVDLVGLKYVLNKLKEKNADLYLAKEAQAKSAAKVANSLKVTVGDTEVTFNGSAEQVVPAAAAKVHSHTAADITDFATEVGKVITGAGGTTHTHENKDVLDGIDATDVAAWDAKIGTGDVAKLAYANDAMTGVADVKAAIDVLVKNVQIGSAQLSLTTANVNGLAERLTTAEQDIDAAEGKITTLETTVGDTGSGLVKKVADLEDANKDGGAVANAIADAKQAGLDAQSAVAAEKTRAEAAEKANADAIAAINNETTGILAQAKEYADGKDADIAAAKKAGTDAQTAVNALAEKVGTVADGKTVVGLIADAQAQADKGVTDAATAQAAADTAQADVDALEAKVGTVPEDKTVVQMIADAITEATYDDSAIKADIKANADAIDAIEADYLKAADKTELEGKITTAQETANAAKTKIETFMAAADVTEDAIDTLKEIQEYIESDGKAAATMTQNIADNKAAIDTINNVDTGILAQAKADATAKDTALKTELEGAIATAKSEAISAAATDATTKDNALKTELETEIGKKADNTALEAEVERATAAEKANADAIAILNGNDTTAGSVAKAVKDAVDPVATKVTTAEGEIDALQEVVGDASNGLVKDVADLKTTVGGATSGLVKKVADLETATEGLDGRLDTAETDIDNLEAALGNKTTDTKDSDTVYGKLLALADKDTAQDKVIATKAAAADLTALTTRVGTAEGEIDDLKVNMTGAQTDITNLQTTLNQLTSLTETELQAMLDEVYPS